MKELSALIEDLQTRVATFHLEENGKHDTNGSAPIEPKRGVPELLMAHRELVNGWLEESTRAQFIVSLGGERSRDPGGQFRS